ncbi:abscisic acid 8'-hydroxylase 1-like [Zingiber officinale]|uniref:abscisic acid 8'-hydroxylase 1-like n=1 Tax=Zingiber officinale TaxID=94328 RepID=UPI001C4CD79F|nr:abscisic acid 8'-hydroxylase 1-like [Zingiber officinale]
MSSSSITNTAVVATTPMLPLFSMTILLLLLLLLCLFAFCCFVFRLSLAGRSGYLKLTLPPGSMGWPYVGETFQLYSNDPTTFFALKQKRYGPVFKTHILGCPCVMVSSPEAARFVLVTRAQLFKPTYPASKERMIGPQAIFFQQGDYHAHLRRLVLRAFLPEAIRGSVAGIEAVALRALRSWDGRLVNTFRELKTYAFNVAILSIFGKDLEISCLEDLQQCYYTLEKGYNSMPVNLPGTLFYRAMKARKQLAQIVANIVCSRRTQRNTSPNGLLGSFMDAKEDLSDDQIADNVIGVIFAARDTTASVLTWIIKYLGDNPNILRAVTEEQEQITKSKLGNESLTWPDTKNMPLTSRVIQETMRVASILSFTFREAVEDVEYEGYLIPKGWKVLPLFRNIHHSPENFSDPEKFDPSRFEVAPKPNTFMPFGNGTHSCPGNELAKLEMLVLLHHLTTKYTWSTVSSPRGMQFGPFVLPTNGLPLRFSLKSTAA